jgi:hypothetical protein
VTIWIDAPAWPAHGRLWSHLISDTSFEELHAFARANGIPRRGFEGDHYDVPEERYAALVAAGACPAVGRDLVRRLHASGLRVPKRRHERVLQTLSEPPWLPRGSRVDVISSRQDGPPANTVVVRLLAHAQGSILVVPRDDGGLDLPARRVVASSAADSPPDRLAHTLAAVQREVLGDPAEATLVGYVRNTVPEPGADYPWPAPRACFAVFARPVTPPGPPGGAPVDPLVARARWLPLNDAAERLGGRHWWPLLPEFFSRPGH